MADDLEDHEMEEEYVYSDDDADDGPASRGGASDASGAAAGAAAAAPPSRQRASLGAGAPHEYTKLTPSQVEEEQRAAVRDVASVLSLPAEVAHLLLAAFR